MKTFKRDVRSRLRDNTVQGRLYTTIARQQKVRLPLHARATAKAGSAILRVEITRRRGLALATTVTITSAEAAILLVIHIWFARETGTREAQVSQ